MKNDKHYQLVRRKSRGNPAFAKAFTAALQQIDLVLLVREMREEAGLTQSALARIIGSKQSVIARLEDAEYTGHSLAMLEKIAAACDIRLRLHAERKPGFDRVIALV
ncbi:MAG: XRE family transcriptional regulator [Acidobacteria bacterium]|nr:XRE family transcriptional regulator [Acidobacteriota bacterium]